MLLVWKLLPSPAAESAPAAVAGEEGACVLFEVKPVDWSLLNRPLPCPDTAPADGWRACVLKPVGCSLLMTLLVEVLPRLGGTPLVNSLDPSLVEEGSVKNLRAAADLGDAGSALTETLIRGGLLYTGFWVFSAL